MYIPPMAKPLSTRPTSKLARTGLIKRLSEGNSHSLLSALVISFRSGLFVGLGLRFFGGAYGVLSRNGLADAVGITAADVTPVGVAFLDWYLAPRKPQIGQSLWVESTLEPHLGQVY